MGEKQKNKIVIRHPTIVIDIIQQQKPDIVRKILNKCLYNYDRKVSLKKSSYQV